LLGHLAAFDLGDATGRGLLGECPVRSGDGRAGLRSPSEGKREAG